MFAARLREIEGATYDEDAIINRPAMRISIPALTALFACVLLAARGDGENNDLMYPPAPAAKQAIDIDGRGFIINGRRPTSPRAASTTRAFPTNSGATASSGSSAPSFNGVQTYAFWNFHEPRENEFDFTATGTSARS